MKYVILTPATVAANMKIETLWLQFDSDNSLESVSDEPMFGHTAWVKKSDHLALLASMIESAAERSDAYADVWDDRDINGSSISVISRAIRGLKPKDAEQHMKNMIFDTVEKAREEDKKKIAELQYALDERIRATLV